MRKVSRQNLLTDAIRVYHKTGGLTRDAYRQHGKYDDQQIADHFNGFADFRNEVLSSVPGVTSTSNTPTEVREFGKTNGVVATVNKNVRTLDDLLAYMEVDLNVWEVEKHTINKWEVAMREPASTVGGAGDKALIVEGEKGRKSTLWTRGSNVPMHEPLYQVKAWLIRKTPLIQNEAFESIAKRVESLAPKMSAVSYPKRSGNYLLEVSLYDAHFGLLAWGKETGEHYDLKIAEKRFGMAIDDLLRKTQGCVPEKIVLPVGNDFFHVNNPEGVTPMSKNVLDTDGRLCKIVEYGERALINAVQTCLTVAPVSVLWIPGNHDPETSYFMCRILRAFFLNNKSVDVDVSPAARKYVHYGCNLIGYTHGNEERHSDLPTIMANERKDVWGQVTHREWHVGHYHKRKETRFSAGDTFGGVAVKVIPSICGTDAWHFRKGYVGNNKIAEAHLYDKRQGLAATFVSQDLQKVE
jgi:hypothetical protein